MQKQKSIGFILFASFLIIILILVFRTQPHAVDMVRAQYASMQVTTEEEGKTRVIERYVVTAPIDAFMHRIHLNEGDLIEQGQTLLTLEPIPSSILDPRSRAQAEATLGATEELEKIINEMSEASKADKDLAIITFDRTTKLRKDKVVSQNEMDVVKAEKRRAEAVYRASQFASVFTQYLTKMSRSALDYEDMRQSGNELRRFNVNSTSRGTVLKLADKSERVVKMGDVIMEIGDLSQLEVEVEVLSTVAVQLKLGMPVEILRWGGQQLLEGEIKRIEPSGFTKISALGVEEQRVKVIIKFTSEPSQLQQVKDAFRVEVRFVLWQSDRVLQIPNSAIFRDKGTKSSPADRQWFVYVISENRLQKREIKVGHRNHLMAEVINGVKENEQVVSYLTNDMNDGLRVTVN